MRARACVYACVCESACICVCMCVMLDKLIVNTLMENGRKTHVKITFNTNEPFDCVRPINRPRAFGRWRQINKFRSQRVNDEFDDHNNLGCSRPKD